MENFYNLALTEYKDLQDSVKGSYFMNILISVGLLVLSAIMLGIHDPFRTKAEERHFGFLLGNAIYLIAILLEFDSRGFFYTLGSISGEITRHISVLKEAQTYLFVFSAIFIYSFYILLLSPARFYFSLFFSFVLACSFTAAYHKIYYVYLLTQALAQSVLITLSAYSIAMLFLYKTPSLKYIENISLILVGGIFTANSIHLIRTKWKKLRELSV